MSSLDIFLVHFAIHGRRNHLAESLMHEENPPFPKEMLVSHVLSSFVSRILLDSMYPLQRRHS